MVGLIIFTKLVDALVSSYTNLGSKLPKNDATITRKKDDTTVNVRYIQLKKSPGQVFPQFKWINISANVFGIIILFLPWYCTRELIINHKWSVV